MLSSPGLVKRFSFAIFLHFSFKVPPKPIVHWLVVPRFRLLGLTRVYVAVRGEGDKAVWKTKAQLEPALTY